MMMRPSGRRVTIMRRFDDRKHWRGPGSPQTPSRTLVASRHRLGHSVHTAPLDAALIIAPATDRARAFLWMIKAEYVAEFMDGPPGFADRLDEISCSSEACPAA